MIAAVAGAALVGPGAAAAAPEATYPAPPPTATVNAASVTPGATVRVAGTGFASGEPVAYGVAYRIFRGTPAFPAPGGGGVARANGAGDVKARVTLTFPGYATIRLDGLRSHRHAQVTVRVTAWGGQWPMFFRPGTFTGPFGGGALGAAAFGGTFGGPCPEAATTAGPISYRAGPSELTLASSHQQAPDTSAGAQLVAGLLGLVALTGSALFTFRTARRPAQ